MNITNLTESCIRINNITNFDIDKIINSGQCFRWNKLGTTYSGVVLDKLLEIEKLTDTDYIFYCSKYDFDSFWRIYFDLDRNYTEINSILLEASSDDKFIRESIKVSNGIRILNQPIWETIVTFILSQQNNIPRIKLIIENLCNELGTIHKNKLGRTYLEFPSAEVIKNHPEVIKYDIGSGFRDKYILSTADMYLDNEDMYQRKNCSYEEVLSNLKLFYGVGDKIANCIALYAYGCLQAFPEDVWIKRIISTYDTGFNRTKYHKYAGVVQQYMYYYVRLLEDKI